MTVLAVIELASIFLVGFTASSYYGRRWWPWALLAFFIGIFAFIPLLIAGNTKNRRSAMRAR
jgi:hypothetical protein